MIEGSDLKLFERVYCIIRALEISKRPKVLATRKFNVDDKLNLFYIL